MVASFYQAHAKTLLWGVAITFPLLALQADLIPSNNDIETWLPRDAEVRTTYEQFKRDFGADETVLIAVPARMAEPKLVAAVASRLNALPGVRQCWTKASVQEAMRDMNVPPAEMERRLSGFVVSRDGKTVGLVVILSKTGLENRLETVKNIREQLAYCQLDDEAVSLAGSPIVVAELDRLGNSKNNKQFFLITLLISLALLYYSLRDWKLTAAILGITVWAINLTTVIVMLTGGEMNFILGALSVMVMVFTLANCVHFLHYFHASRHEPNPLNAALRRAWKPCGLATLTTTIGLLSLMVSDIGAVRSFGVAASIGSVVAMMTALGLMPAVLTVCKPTHPLEHEAEGWFVRASHWLMDRRRPVAVVIGMVFAATSVGLIWLESRIEPLDFLPKNNRVLTDVQRVEAKLTKMSSIEAVVDFGDDDSAFVTKLEKVRRIEEQIQAHPCIDKTMSAASFFPARLPDDPYQTAALLKRAQQRWSGNHDFIADGERLWRISARIPASPERSRKQIIEELQLAVQGVPLAPKSEVEGQRSEVGGRRSEQRNSDFRLPASAFRPPSVTFTGVAPLLEEAQQSIFTGFWESFITAFGIISLVMVISLRSLKAGLVAMFPNLWPICIVFGMLGWLRIPVDIGMMMTGSIALGIAVDGTFHFLVHYEQRHRDLKDTADASRDALLQTGAPILKAGVIAAIGMLALTLSNFVPTARFGYMMALLLMAALVGDLVLLPVILAMRPRWSRQRDDAPSADDAPAISVIPVPHVLQTPVHPRKKSRA
jgi:predicted RND superfamily exporter protein